MQQGEEDAEDQEGEKDDHQGYEQRQWWHPSSEDECWKSYHMTRSNLLWKSLNNMDQVSFIIVLSDLEQRF